MADVAPAGDPVADIGDVLRGIPLLADLPAEVLADLADVARWVHVRAGQHLFRQGDEAGAMAIVWTGRLEVLNEDDEVPLLAGVLTRGAWVGELSLLTGAPRSASVRALRDAQLLTIPRDAFERTLTHRPELGVALARTLAAQLQRSRSTVSRPRRPDTIAVLPLGGPLPLDPVTQGILRQATRRGRAVVLDGSSLTGNGGGPDAWSAMLDRAEADHETVVLVCRDPEAEADWCAFCCRSADRVVALLRGGKPPAWAIGLLHGRADLVFVGSSLLGARIAPGLAALEPRAHHHLPEGTGQPVAIERLARRVTGGSIGLVLSGGGARGLAHIGVLEVLTSNAIPVDRIGGCSAGALVAGLHVSGRTPAEIAAIARTELVDHHPFADVTVPRESLIKGRRAMAMLTRMFGELRIEELSLPFFAVSADLTSGELVTHRSGRLRDAVAASMAIPGFAPPLRMGDRLHVDGGILDNLPIDVMERDDEGPIIGVDVMRDFATTGAEHRSSPPGIVTTIARAMVLAGWTRSERNRRLADVLLSPAVERVGLFEFEAIDEAITAGREATTLALPEIRDLVGAPAGPAETGLP